MKPYYENSGIVIYNADWREVFPTLPQVDHTITDPPYADRTHKGAMTNKSEAAKDGYRQGGSKLVNFDCLSDSDFETLCKEVLKKTKRWAVMTCDHRHAALTFDWAEHIRLGVWVKGAPMPQITGDRPGSGHESILILHNEGKKRWNGGGRPAVWNAMVIKDPKEVFVATQKPIKLLTQLVADFTDENEVILDPFMGSGTTLRAAKDLHRQCIGIEIDESKCEIAARRIDQEVFSF